MSQEDAKQKHSHGAELAALRRQNDALLAEVEFLRGSLRMRGASIIAEAIRSPRALLLAPWRLLTFICEVRAVWRWRRVVLGLECGLPDDPLRSMIPDAGESVTLRKIAKRVFAGQAFAASGDDLENPIIAAAARRSVELSRLATSGPNWADAAPRVSAVNTSQKIVMALNMCEPDVVNGYTRRSHELISALQNLGWNIRPAVRGATAEDTLQNGSLDYHRIGIPNRKAEGLDCYVSEYSDYLFDFIQKERPALVHAASNHITGRAAAIAAERMGCPFIYEIRGLWEVTRISVEPAYAGSVGFNAQRRLEIETAKRADRVLVNGAAIGALIAEAGVDHEKIVIAPNGCNPGEYQFNAEKIERLRSKWGIDNRPVVGFVGSLTAYEGLDVVFRALAGVKDAPFQILIVGDGSARPQLEAIARKHRISDCIRWAGRISPEQAKESYSLIDIAPLVRLDTPVSRLTPPLKPLDAMAAGAALIVSDLPPLREFADDGRGLIVPPNDEAALRAALERLLVDSKLRQSMITVAKQWVHANRQWSHVAEKIADTYQSIIV